MAERFGVYALLLSKEPSLNEVYPFEPGSLNKV